MPHDKKIFAFAKVQKTVVVNCYLKLNLLAETLPMTNNGRSIIVTAHMSQNVTCVSYGRCDLDVTFDWSNLSNYAFALVNTIIDVKCAVKRSVLTPF